MGSEAAKTSEGIYVGCWYSRRLPNALDTSRPKPLLHINHCPMHLILQSLSLYYKVCLFHLWFLLFLGKKMKNLWQR